MRTITAAILAAIMGAVAPIWADEAQELVRTANQAVRHELSPGEVSWLVRHYGHHPETYRMARELAEFGVIHAEGERAWDGRAIALAYQLFTQQGRREVALAQALLKALEARPGPQGPPGPPGPPGPTGEVRLKVEVLQPETFAAPAEAATGPRWVLQTQAGPEVPKVLVYRQTSLWDKFWGSAGGPLALIGAARARRPDRITVHGSSASASADAEASADADASAEAGAVTNSAPDPAQ